MPPVGTISSVELLHRIVMNRVISVRPERWTSLVFLQMTVLSHCRVTWVTRRQARARPVMREASV